MLSRHGGCMRTNYLVFCLWFASLAALAADQRGVVIEKPVDVVARTLLAKLPPLASDGMCEVERESNGWNFQFRVKADKTSAEEVQVIVRRAEAMTTDLRIQGVRIESAMITSKRSADPELSKAWSERIRKLIEEPG